MFSSRSFIVVSLKFRSLIHFEFVFVYAIRECPNFILLHIALQFYCLFTIVYSYLFCHKLIDHRCMGLFLGFLSCPIDLYFWFCASTMLF